MPNKKPIKKPTVDVLPGWALGVLATLSGLLFVGSLVGLCLGVVSTDASLTAFVVANIFAVVLVIIAVRGEKPSFGFTIELVYQAVCSLKNAMEKMLGR